MRLINRRCVRVGPLVIDHERRSASVGEADLYLSPREFDLLAKLAEDPERLVSMDEIKLDTFGGAVGVTRRTVEACAERVRRKLELREMPNAVQFAGGVGFRLLNVGGDETAGVPADRILREVA